MWTYIIIGGGSAGCVLVNRLSENPANDLLLLEAGAGQKEKLPIFTAPAGARYLIKNHVITEVSPGVERQSTEELRAWLQDITVDTAHPSGTCKMGSDELAVVDARLKVRGIENLRVADASIMPTITTGNTNAPTIMIGEKAAHMILEDKKASMPINQTSGK